MASGIKLNLVDDYDLLINKGDAIAYTNKELGWVQLIIVCPGCGEKSASAGKHKFDRDTLSYTPSIIHDKSLDGCGWHGWLTNGEFKEC